MKTTMASAALLLVLAMALVSAPLTVTAEAKKKKKAESATAAGMPKLENSYCGRLCHGYKGTYYVVCKDSCDLNEKVNLLSHSRIQCDGKCTEQKGITKEQMVVCLEQCGKDYKVKAAEITAACNKTCALEKYPPLQESCKSGCTPPS